MGDILIKGMEMPTTCKDCRLSTFTDFDRMPFCNITMDDICLNDWETKRCDNCPLVFVPPHGDLVDRDETIKAGKSHPTYKNSKIVKAVVDKACCFLKTATVVIPANKEN